MSAEIRHHGCRNRNVTESVTATLDRNRIYAESVKIYFFGAENETETEIRSVFSIGQKHKPTRLWWVANKSSEELKVFIATVILITKKSTKAITCKEYK